MVQFSERLNITKLSLERSNPVENCPKWHRQEGAPLEYGCKIGVSSKKLTSTSEFVRRMQSKRCGRPEELLYIDQKSSAIGTRTKQAAAKQRNFHEIGLRCSWATDTGRVKKHHSVPQVDTLRTSGVRCSTRLITNERWVSLSQTLKTHIRKS